MNKLLLIKSTLGLKERIVEACMKQGFVGDSAVAFAWTCVPYRTEWSYDKVSHKLIAMDAGHLCQNLYLACESADIACCAVGAYHQDLMDQLLGVDGVEEFTIYMAAMGKQ
jgi:SagB-type dehydrogenase family enzyme